jgi:Flp pilus assembly protein TadG
MTAITFRMPRVLRRLARDRRGVSAVEFALVAPMMIALYFGCVEIADGIAVDRKVSLAAAALANLPAQVSTITADEMNNILDASTAILAPYSPGPLKMTVSCLKIDANQNVTVKWTVTRNGTPLTGDAVTLDNALKVANSELIYAQVSYDYTPIIGAAMTGMITLSDKMYMAPRVTAPKYVAAGCT